jgi:Arc/MetJ-type ribon-helix-helix transcriptional regulator
MLRSKQLGSVKTEMPNRFRTIKLPEEMAKHIELMVSRHPEWGYRSMADFVKDSVRHNFHWLAQSDKLEQTQ